MSTILATPLTTVAAKGRIENKAKFAMLNPSDSIVDRCWVPRWAPDGARRDVGHRHRRQRRSDGAREGGAMEPIDMHGPAAVRAT
jgi:hypothetical protein